MEGVDTLMDSIDILMGSFFLGGGKYAGIKIPLSPFGWRAVSQKVYGRRCNVDFFSALTRGNSRGSNSDSEAVLSLRYNNSA